MPDIMGSSVVRYPSLLADIAFVQVRFVRKILPAAGSYVWSSAPSTSEHSAVLMIHPTKKNALWPQTA